MVAVAAVLNLSKWGRSSDVISTGPLVRVFVCRRAVCSFYVIKKTNIHVMSVGSNFGLEHISIN